MEDKKHLTKSEVKALVDDLHQRVDDLSESRQFPWDDVFASMLEYHDKVVWSNKKCATCQQPLIEIFFRSPSWTWKMMCGSCGTMTICPACAKQLDYETICRN